MSVFDIIALWIGRGVLFMGGVLLFSTFALLVFGSLRKTSKNMKIMREFAAFREQQERQQERRKP